jgi:outer membrane protein assembly factor BamB
LDGLVDAQPLYVAGVSIPNQGTHNVLIAATENDSLYALDADTGAQLWKVALLGSGETASDARLCNQVVPEIGITSTPVIWLQPGTTEGVIYAVAMSKDSSGNYHQRLFKVNLATGKLLAHVEVTGKYPGTGDDSQNGYAIFDPKQYKERSGLLLLNGVVYLAWA